MLHTGNRGFNIIIRLKTQPVEKITLLVGADSSESVSILK